MRNPIPPIFSLVILASVLSAQDTRESREAPKRQQNSFGQQWLEPMQWRSIGPANMGGRITALAVYEKDPSLYYVGTATGGLLKTTNKGVTFEHLFDHETTVAIGDVAVAASDPKIVWVGTGEENPRNSVSYGDGVYKSVDGGKTWKNMGLKDSFQIGSIKIHPSNPAIVYVGALGRLYGPNEERGLYKTENGGKSWSKIHYVDDKTGVIEMIMHPTDPDTLIIATYERQRDGYDTNSPAKKIAPGSGLWRTTDGGKTVTKLSDGLPTNNIGRIGLDWYRKDPNVVFAIIETEKMGGTDPNIGWTGFDTQNAETGAKVTRVTKDGPAAKAGLKSGDIVLAVDGSTVLSSAALQKKLVGKMVEASIELEVARGGESRSIEFALAKRPKPGKSSAGGRGRRGGGSRLPYSGRLGGQSANVQDLQGPNGHEFGGVFRSDDMGTTWKRINSIDPRPMYFSQIRVDPSNDQNLYVLGISAYRSKDGGKTFTSDASRGVHSDQHALWVDPSDGRHLLIGADGGLYQTYDQCANWDHLNHMALGQFYHVAVGPRRDYWVYGGLQDNGTWGAPHRASRGYGTVNEDWLRIGGGDGFVVRVDPNDPDQIYYESQNGSTGRTHMSTMESGRTRAQAPKGTRYRYNWQTPFILSHHNSKIYYNAGNHVFRSLDRGNDLKSISPDITRGERGSATALAESHFNSDVLYVGTDDGALHGTLDGGHTWNDLWVIPTVEETGIGTEDTPKSRGPMASTAGKTLAELVPGPRWVSALETSRHKKGRVYLALDAHRSDDDNPYVLVSEDNGKSWSSIVANLPRGSTRTIREDLTNENLLYVGTEFGIYISLDRGGKWLRLNNNLPTVPVHEVAQHRSSGEVVVATHGRSLWILDVTSLRQLTAEAQKADAHLYDPNDVVVWRSKHRRASSGARTFRGENPGSNAQLFYSLTKKAASVSLEVQDQTGATLRALEVKSDPGMHVVSWDLRKSSPAGQASQGRNRYRRRGGRSVPAGTYVAVLTVDGKAYSQSFEIQSDPNFPAGSNPGRGFDEDEDEDGEDR